jgi:hypothetical protein
VNRAPAERRACSSIALAIGEPLYGSAPTAQAWILLEQPGGWGPDALNESDVDAKVAAGLARRAEQFSCRILLIRKRSGRYEPSRLSCYLASSAPGAAWMERIEVRSAFEVLECELEALCQPEPPGIGMPENEVYLVCTHGRRDPCCAELGRSLLNGLSKTDAPVWESSHQGGHRFAANLACFPHGLFYGRVRQGDGAEIIASYRRSEIYLPCYRGRSPYDSLVQAADYFVRSETGVLGIDVPRLERIVHENRRASVSFRNGSKRYSVDLRLVVGEPRPESCNKPEKLTKPETWLLDGFTGSTI